jgi:hypothetical protein
VLADHAVDLGIGWPEIAAQLGVTRQAARQAYLDAAQADASDSVAVVTASATSTTGTTSISFQ